MKPQTDACDPDRLEMFLSGQLSDVDEADLALHLDKCPSCCRHLERQAAEVESWQEAQWLLKAPLFNLPACESSRTPEISTPVEEQTQPISIQSVVDLLKPTDDPQMLGRVAGYEVSGVVGVGGMGIVLKAIDKSLDRTVAIKVLAPHLASNGAARKRFSREAKAAAAVLHPNVIAIHSVSNDESLPHLVMPYIRGSSLQKRIDREGPLPLTEILRIGSQIAAGLAAAHGQGLVHRDIKPANILLEEGVERVTITDFGLARALDDATIMRSGVIAGTPQFMSPEQARGEPLNQQSDLFSLGSVFYAMCTGRPPFRAETSYGVMRRIIDDHPLDIRDVNPDIPAWMCRIIDRLMCKRAADRFESAAELRRVLEQCLAHVQQPTAISLPESVLPASKSAGILSFSHHKTGVIIVVAVCVFCLVGILSWMASEPHPGKGTDTPESMLQVQDDESNGKKAKPAEVLEQAIKKELQHQGQLQLGEQIEYIKNVFELPDRDIKKLEIAAKGAAAGFARESVLQLRSDEAMSPAQIAKEAKISATNFKVSVNGKEVTSPYKTEEKKASPVSIEIEFDQFRGRPSKFIKVDYKDGAFGSHVQGGIDVLCRQAAWVNTVNSLLTPKQQAELKEHYEY